MIRATTPIHTFKFTENPSDFSDMLITYKQDDLVVLEKHKTDLTITSHTESGVTVYYGAYSLSQEETRLFKAGTPCLIQIRALSNTDMVLASKIFKVEVLEVLDDEVLD